MKSAFDKIAAGLSDAIAHANGETGYARVAAPIDVAAIRKRTGKTQDQFARAYHLPLGTVRDWEQSRSQPDAPARVLLALIKAEPDTIEQLVQRA
ncbi:transcriptional regulator [Sphingomonas sp. PP-CC-3G-468]|uniref:helix-turn-helix domain-containing protein n=1 Tax=Sphingomonas sp. PP-CC-3G-468 TaxID=2135656 RepID=UPI001051CE25|nr:transcriptional regulator [Sphingomonas sp. PP-CC-3G-468]TCM04523.1 Xre family transcriptional regulator [Sphingomonas sp. PP-CC-3G-468]